MSQGTSRGRGPAKPGGGAEGGSGDRPVQYSFAVLRAVPHPYTGEGVDVGVVVHSRPADYLGVRVVSDPDELGRMVGDVDVELLARYLDSCAAIAAGDEGAGPIALLSAPERFHWLTSPRSDVLQCSEVHAGMSPDPAAELDRIFRAHVHPPGAGGAR